MKTFLATIIGIVVAIAATKGLEILGHNIFPVKLDIDPNNIEELKLIMFKIPVYLLVVIVFAHTLGLFLGFIVSRLIERKSILPLYYISGLMILLAVINLILIKHPTWFIISDLLALLLVSIAYIGTRKKA